MMIYVVVSEFVSMKNKNVHITDVDIGHVIFFFFSVPKKNGYFQHMIAFIYQ